MYKLFPLNNVIRLSDQLIISFGEGNTEYQQFKRDIAEGAELQDADGNVMSAEAVAEFLNTLP